MQRDAILKRLQELASERGGHIGFRAFLGEIGMSEHWLRGQPWFHGWNVLLKEVGLETRHFSPPTRDIDDSVAVLVELVIRYGRWPTEDQLKRERATNPSVPSPQFVRKMRRTGDLEAVRHCLEQRRPDLLPEIVVALETLKDEQDASQLQVPGDRVRGYVYLLRSGRRYKIGKSQDPSRRFREIKLELPEETVQVHSIPTDDPTGIEAYWHNRFRSKRVRNTEFFELDASDVRAFKLRKYQ